MGANPIPGIGLISHPTHCLFIMADYRFQDESKVQEVAQQLLELLNENFSALLSCESDVAFLANDFTFDTLKRLTNILIEVTARMNDTLSLPAYQEKINTYTKIIEERNTK